MIDVVPFYFCLYAMGFCCFFSVFLQIKGTKNGILNLLQIQISPTGCIILIIVGILLCLPFAIWFYRYQAEKICDKYIEPPRRMRRTQEEIAELKNKSKPVCFTQELLDNAINKLKEVPNCIENVENIKDYDKLFDNIPVELSFFYNDFQYKIGFFMEYNSMCHIKRVIMRGNGADKETLVSLFKEASGEYLFTKKSLTMFDKDGWQIQYGSDFTCITHEELMEKIKKDNLLNATVEVYSSKRFFE